MHILFVSVADATDIRTWSGTPLHMYQALTACPGVTVSLASPLPAPAAQHPLRLAARIAGRLGTSVHLEDREPLVLRGYARRVRQAIARTRPDVVLCPSTVPLAAVPPTVPLAAWTDATWAAMAGYYPEFSGLSPRTRRCGERAERLALARVSLAIYSSPWAAASARETYGVPADRVAVVPFGANLAGVPVPEDVGDRLAALDRSRCDLLLVGRDWHRKGVDDAVAATGLLRDAGVAARLRVIGCRPPHGARVPDYVTVLPDLDKADPRDAAELADRFRTAAFFLLPSRAECSPIVLAEAQAFGVPVIAARTGGVGAMLADGRSGVLVDAGAFPSAAAAAVARIWAAPPRYDAMAAAARRFHAERVNWRTAAATAVQRLRAIRSHALAGAAP